MLEKKKNFQLGLAVAALGFLAVACGTAGENTGFGRGPTGIAPAPGGTAAAAAAAGVGTGSLTGGATGTATVNPDLAGTLLPGLLKRNILATGTPLASNAPTRLGLGEFGTLGQRAVVVQGNLNGISQGRVTLLPRNPGNPDGNGNIQISGVGSELSNPFGLAVRPSGGSDEIIVTNQVNVGNLGQVVRIRAIQESGAATISTAGLTNLNAPFDIALDGNFAFVCENFPVTGRVLRIDLDNADPAAATTEILTGLTNATALALDTSSGRRLLYVVENGFTGGGALGRVLRVDLDDPGFPLSGGTAASPGVTQIGVQAGEVPFAFPFDVAVDNFGNLIISEGLTYNPLDGTIGGNTPGQGRIRVLQAPPPLPAALPPTPESRLVLRGLTSTRGLSVIAENPAGTVNTVFFVEGVNTASTVRQLTFNNTDGAIFRHLILDQDDGGGGTLGPILNPFDTLFDLGSTTPLVPANLKYSIGFNGGVQGRVRDVR